MLIFSEKEARDFPRFLLLANNRSINKDIAYSWGLLLLYNENAIWDRRLITLDIS
jgi:hypothetical protein